MLSQQAAGQRQVARRIVVGRIGLVVAGRVALGEPGEVEARQVDQPLLEVDAASVSLIAVGEGQVGEASRQAARFVPAIRRLRSVLVGGDAEQQSP
jgi:hypothetical protein